MNGDDQPGQKFVARQDVYSGNQIAFVAGEPMILWREEPLSVTPGYRYVVYSTRLQKYVSLSDREIAPFHEVPPPQVAGPGAPIPPPIPTYSQQLYPAAAPTRNKSLVATVVIACTVVFLGAIVFALAILIPTQNSVRRDAQRRTCQANQRTIDGAIQVYNAQYDAFPPGGEVGDIFVPWLIRRNPTCPTSGKTYTIVPGSPPIVTCPTNVSGHSIPVY